MNDIVTVYRAEKFKNEGWWSGNIFEPGRFVGTLWAQIDTTQIAEPIARYLSAVDPYRKDFYAQEKRLVGWSDMLSWCKEDIHIQPVCMHFDVEGCVLIAFLQSSVDPNFWIPVNAEYYANLLFVTGANRVLANSEPCPYKQCIALYRDETPVAVFMGRVKPKDFDPATIGADLTKEHANV